MKKLQLFFHFLTLKVYTQETQVISWLEQAFVSNDLREHFSQNTVTLTLNIARQSNLPPEKADNISEAVFTGYSFGPWPCYFKAGHFISEKVGQEYLYLDYDYVNARIQCYLADEFFENSTIFLHLFFRMLLRSFIFQLNGLIPLHGAAVQKGGVGTLLLGDKGAGKSTLALAFARQGYSIIADDAPFLTQYKGNAVILSSLDTPRVTLETIILQPEYATVIGPDEDMFGKYALLRQQLPDTFFELNPAHIHKILFLRRNGNSSLQHSHLRPGEALSQLIEEYALVFQNPTIRQYTPSFTASSRFTFEMLTQLTENAESFSLDYANSSLDELINRIESL
jgi:hypothetical protein